MGGKINTVVELADVVIQANSTVYIIDGELNYNEILSRKRCFASVQNMAQSIVKRL